MSNDRDFVEFIRVLRNELVAKKKTILDEMTDSLAEDGIKVRGFTFSPLSPPEGDSDLMETMMQHLKDNIKEVDLNSWHVWDVDLAAEGTTSLEETEDPDRACYPVLSFGRWGLSIRVICPHGD